MDSQNKCEENWGVDTAKSHYRINKWGLQHFDINALGHVVASIDAAKIDLYELSRDLKEKNITLPVLVRFPQILQQSLNDMCKAFGKAIDSNQYKGKYLPAYPIKVNQQASVIQHFQNQTQRPIAFEVGSKAELIACLGISDKQQTIICNGYKDAAYIRLALIGLILGHEVIIVIEKLSEVKYILEQSSELNVQPGLGMRVRLTSIAKGNWQNTGGEFSKFGLTSNQALGLINLLQENNALNWMKMLHFHMGSQIPALNDIESGVAEGMHYFSELSNYGVQFEYINVGGGLAVDYEGSGAATYFSMDYSTQMYASTIVEAVNSFCEKHSLLTPTIISENGRAMAAHHAVMITNVIDAEYQSVDLEENFCIEKLDELSNTKLTTLLEYINEIEELPKSSSELSRLYKEIKKTIASLELEFSAGKLTLAEKATSEKLAKYALLKILKTTQGDSLQEQDLLSIEDKFVAKYFCNFSLFQSTPDIWGLKQIFPILPLHRLNECPSVKTRIYDLTCDSDGRIDEYVEADSIQSCLSLHKVSKHQDYLLGIFLVGAYQEILGDMHNLFGDTNAVNIVVDQEGSYQICDAEPGDTVAEILSYLHIDTGRMRQNWSQRLASVDASESNIKLVMDTFISSLNENSYLS